MLALPVALLAGLVSFFSPCVVPLLPGYLSYATGLSGADLERRRRRGRMLAGALLFVLGFSFVFVASARCSAPLGDWLLELPAADHHGARRASRSCSAWSSSGVVPWLQRDLRDPPGPAVGLAAAPLLGVLFGLGWTPCIGPTLGRGANLALNEGTRRRAARCSASSTRLGLGSRSSSPALAYRRMLGAVGWVRRHQLWVIRARRRDAGRRRAAAGHRPVGPLMVDLQSCGGFVRRLSRRRSR